jgi:hypothetical protein
LDTGFDFIDIDPKFQVQLFARLCVGLSGQGVSVLVVVLFVEFFLEGFVWMFGALVGGCDLRIAQRNQGIQGDC